MQWVYWRSIRIIIDNRPFRLRNVVGVALREYVFWGVAGPPFLQLSSILPMDCIQIFALCVAAGFMFE